MGGEYLAACPGHLTSGGEECHEYSNNLTLGRPQNRPRISGNDLCELVLDTGHPIFADEAIMPS